MGQHQIRWKNRRTRSVRVAYVDPEYVPEYLRAAVGNGEYPHALNNAAWVLAQDEDTGEYTVYAEGGIEATFPDIEAANAFIALVL